MYKTVSKTVIGIAIAITALTLLTQHSFANDNEINFGGDFSLTDQNNQPFSLKQMRGKIVLLFFGYSYCANACPKELSKIAAAIKSMGDNQPLVQGLFVTIDPERDTPEKIKTYVNYFSPDLIGLTGSTEQIKTVAELYKVDFKLNKSSESDLYYEIDHTANLYIIDQNGKLVRLVPYNYSSSQVSSILKDILATRS